MRLVLASRGSALALWQAEHVRARLERAGGSDVEIRIVHTTGDRVTDAPLSSIGDTGLFTKEVDRTVLDGEADAAVHSMKDVPTETPAGLAIVAVPEREDPRDAFVPAPSMPRRLIELPGGARVGTSSLRRRALLLALRPDLTVEDLRGNLDTRLGRVASGELDGAVLALAGIRRLDREDAVGEVLETPAWLPATGQGALAIVARTGDERVRSIVATLEDACTHREIIAERAFLHELRGGCQVPIGALARTRGGQLTLYGFVAPLDGVGALRAAADGPLAEPEALGRRLARELLTAGAADVLERVRAHRGPLPRASAP